MARGLRNENQTPLRDSNYGHAMHEHLPGGFSKSLAKGATSRIDPHLVRAVQQVHENLRCNIQATSKY